MEALTDEASRANREEGIEPRRLEAAATAGVEVEELRRGASLVLQPLGPYFNPGLSVDVEVGVPARDPKRAAVINPEGIVGGEAFPVDPPKPPGGGAVAGQRIALARDDAVPGSAHRRRRRARTRGPGTAQNGGGGQAEARVRGETEPWRESGVALRCRHSRENEEQRQRRQKSH